MSDPTEHAEPEASRPWMPGYGLLDAQKGDGLLPWSWATEKLLKARNYWIATNRPNGHPHMMPLWGLWMDETFYFNTGTHSRKALNLAGNPFCVVSPESGDHPVVLEGVAEKITDTVLLKRFIEAYDKKYDWPMELTAEGLVDKQGTVGAAYAVHPRLVFGFGSELPASATRWTFDDGR